ncbi:MAG: cytochrome B [Chloroflexi bacterium]|nr:cytochrome B [Chloroflexota bacterium]
MRSVRRVYLYTRFERFWHWMQALLIIGLGITGFEIHGTYTWLGFAKAYMWHVRFGLALVALIVFAAFWHFTTGQWKQYIPSFERIGVMLRYYTQGMFRNEPHPYKKSELSKLNPLQRLTYLVFKILIAPIFVTTGLLMIFYNRWPEWGLNWDLGTVATLHSIAAFLMLIFFIVHVYMTTTGRTLFANIKAMLVGYEEVPWEEADVASVGD